MAKMNCIEISAPGGPEVLRPAKRGVPRVGAGELLVRVSAAGVNRVDVFQRNGLYVPPAGTTDIPGVEFAGVVDACGPGTKRFKVGDRVCGIVGGGAYAEYCVAPEGQVMPVPDGYDFVRAAAFPETFATVWAALFGQGKLEAGESLLVHGGSSGIGTTAIMWARALGTGAIFATAGSPEKCAACVRLGATRAIDYRTEDFVEVVREQTGGEGVDVILDMVAGDYVPRGLSLLKDDGRFVIVGRMSQDLDVNFNVKTVMYKRLVITGVSLRGQSLERKSHIVSQVEKLAWPLLSRGVIAPIVDTVFPLAEAAQAHRLLESSRHIGKVMLQVEGANA